MKANARIRSGIVLIMVLLVFVPAVTAQGAQNVYLTVQTDEVTLGRIVSVVTVPEIGEYSVVITRNMQARPAKAGDSILDKDILTLQRGAYANIQLVDRPDVTMLGGGTDGLAALVSRTGGVAVTTHATVTASGSGEPVITTCIKSGEVGRITFVQGRFYIHRNARILPATVSESLMVDDMIAGDDPDGKIIIQLDYSDHPDAAGYTLTGRTRYALTANCPEPVRSEGLMGDVEGVIETANQKFGELWAEFKKLLYGDSFQVQEPTGGGTRG